MLIRNFIRRGLLSRVVTPKPLSNPLIHKVIRCSSSIVYPEDSFQQKDLAHHLAGRIRLSGALTVADYMRECLLNPVHGYYSLKDSFVGEDGLKESSDFITSPEISAVFGELVAVWFVHQIQQQKLAGTKLNFVEMGPGTGTMMSDMLRTISKLSKANPDLKRDWHIHMVEASPKLTGVQRLKLQSPDLAVEFPSQTWHSNFEGATAAIKGPAVFIGHEFLDALPIHKFQRVESDQGPVWREILVDLKEGDAIEKRSNDPEFRYVLANGPTPASLLLAHSPKDTRKHIEICPQAIQVVSNVARQLADRKQGLALFADYGHVGQGEDTFRGYSKSKQVEPLAVRPGSCDLTADVNFAEIAAVVGKVPGVRAIGPVTQREFLVNMGFIQRLEVLLKTCRQNQDTEGRKRLLGQSEYLLSEKFMGDRFKFMAIVPDCGNVSVAGFSPLW